MRKHEVHRNAQTKAVLGQRKYYETRLMRNPLAAANARAILSRLDPIQSIRLL